MRPSEVLDPKRIKTARDAVGLTQMETAGLVFPQSQEKTRLVTYQRIERTGKTSPKTAIKIANCLNVTVDDLRLNQESANMLLWISHEEDGDEDDKDNKPPGIGATHDSVNLFWELGRILKEYLLKFDHYGKWKIHAWCDFNREKFHIRIGKRALCVEHGTEEHRNFCTITIRFCKFEADKGLLWCKTDQDLSAFIEGRIKSLLFSHADFVVINGKAFPPDGAAICYHVVAYKHLLRDGKVVTLRGGKFLTGRSDFIYSLKKWLHNSPAATVHKMANGLIIQQFVGSRAALSNAKELLEFQHEIRVRYGWLDCNTGAFEEAPWPEYDRANLEARRFVCLQPDWPAENDDAEVPTFEPEMIEMGEQNADAVL